MEPKKIYYVKIRGDRYDVVTLKDGVNPEEYTQRLAEKGITVRKCKGQPPSARTLEKYSFGGIAKATDGCRTEPDGVCSHGNPSWVLALGYM